MRLIRFALAFVAVVGLASPAAEAQECIATNGVFRFLNDEFPPLSTNGPVFTGQLVVANADGPVTFSVDPSSPDPLPDGLSLDPASGLITGLATQSGNETVVFRADDTTQLITRDVTFSISASGGGGNGGSGLANPVFPDGRVGVAYSHAPATDGDGPFVFGASDLLQAGWNSQRWLNGSFAGRHSFTRFLDSYRYEAPELKRVLTSKP